MSAIVRPGILLMLALVATLFSPSPDPAVAGPLTGVAAIAAGGNHTCAVTTGGAVKCWGQNISGQLGAETTEFCYGTPCSTTPVDVVGIEPSVGSDSAGRNYGVLAGVAAAAATAGVVTLVGVAWYVRRRQLR